MRVHRQMTISRLIKIKPINTIPFRRQKVKTQG
nr:MAG TPA: hypothetical protein [Caudoviricetes sp.]